MLFTPSSSQKGKGKKIWQDTMTYPGGGFHWSLGLMGEDSQARYACACFLVCVPTVYDSVFTPGPVLRCCDAECHPTPAWALQPEKPAVKLTGLSPALTYYTLILFSFQHTHKCNHMHTQKRSLFRGLRFRYTCTVHTQLPPPLCIHTYPQTITQASGNLSHASYKHGAKGICSLSSEV